MVSPVSASCLQGSRPTAHGCRQSLGQSAAGRSKIRASRRRRPPRPAACPSIARPGGGARRLWRGGARSLAARGRRGGEGAGRGHRAVMHGRIKIIRSQWQPLLAAATATPATAAVEEEQDQKEEQKQEEQWAGRAREALGGMDAHRGIRFRDMIFISARSWISASVCVSVSVRGCKERAAFRVRSAFHPCCADCRS